jgi:hypothetical protein
MSSTQLPQITDFLGQIFPVRATKSFFLHTINKPSWQRSSAADLTQAMSQGGLREKATKHFPRKRAGLWYVSLW